MAETRGALEAKVIIWKNQLARYGLKLNLRKTEYIEFGAQTSGKISIYEPLTKALTFKYLGSCASYEGVVATDVSAKIQTAWQKWKTRTGVLCKRKLPRKLKSKVYRTVIRPAVLYGSEYWATTKKDEQQLNVMETSMLRRTQNQEAHKHTPNEMELPDLVEPIIHQRIHAFVGTLPTSCILPCALTTERANSKNSAVVVGCSALFALLL
ncbi:hypothetical protein D918_08656 [Trichuris suis]|nr:hypothetical protein D918_08656 [Trichuris suis]